MSKKFLDGYFVLLQWLGEAAKSDDEFIADSDNSDASFKD